MNIYKTTNLINNKIYIGQDSKDREGYLGSGSLLRYAIRKYGRENFKKEVLEICATKEELDAAEKKWIEFYHSQDKTIGYNIAFGGEGGSTRHGQHNTEEQNRKIS